MDRTQELAAAGTAAGLLDPDLLKIAKADLPPKEAVGDLHRRFPGAFKTEPPMKMYAEMTFKERQAFHRKTGMGPPRPERGVPR